MRAPAKLFVWTDEHRVALESLVQRHAVIAADRTPPTPPIFPKVPDLTDRARTLIAQRHARRRAFGPHADIFHDAAWDILLELYVNPKRRPMAVTSVAYAIGAPMTTTLRWLDRMKDRSLLESSLDPHDARMRRVSLSKTAVAMMDAYLEGI